MELKVDYTTISLPDGTVHRYGQGTTLQHLTAVFKHKFHNIQLKRSRDQMLVEDKNAELGFEHYTMTGTAYSPPERGNAIMKFLNRIFGYQQPS